MDKTGRIVAAALMAAGMSYVTPAFSLQTSAETFVRQLSSDFQVSNLASVQAMLQKALDQGIEGVLVDHQIMSLSHLMEILSQVQSGQLNPGRVAGMLGDLIRGASDVRFITGDIRVGAVDLDGDQGKLFPAGSAG